MGAKPVTFRGARGDTLGALLELPVGSPVACALFAHCFGCETGSVAASRIARVLAGQGIAVLRFDFTGLGGEEEPANPSYAPNVEDLVAAADWMREQLQAPRLLLGSSLAGTAMVSALPGIPEAVALATLNASAGSGPVLKLLGAQGEKGEGDLHLGVRRMHLSRGFLEAISEARVAEALHGFDGALLVLQAPRDAFVPMAQAQALVAAARRPASLMALPGADHFLSREEDADFASRLLGAWAARYVAEPVSPRPLPPGVVEVREAGTGRFAQDIRSGAHRLRVDEPLDMGGEDSGPSPYGLLAAALGACTSMTLRMYARNKQWPLEKVTLRLRHTKVHAQDCADCETKAGRLDRIDREVLLEGPLTAEQRARLLEIADRCPVHRTLESEVDVRTRLSERPLWEEEGIPAGG